jgi:hypothetical protein
MHFFPMRSSDPLRIIVQREAMQERNLVLLTEGDGCLDCRVSPPTHYSYTGVRRPKGEQTAMAAFDRHETFDAKIKSSFSA